MGELGTLPDSGPTGHQVQAMSNAAEHLQVIEGEGSSDPLVGKTIDGRYYVEKILGEGGMGLVYRGKHTILNKPLAIKVLRPDVSRDEEIISRFKQEAQSASSIGNQHIIDISDFGNLPDGSTYFIMEFLDGSDLTKVIETQSPVAPNRIVHIAKQLCDALGAAHDAGIVHRDLKPDNIYLVRRGGDSDFVKVLDFGIAKVGGTSSKLTRAGQVFGTPHYMSPEQCAGTGVDHRTDLYAIGIILYEMVTGRTPFDADNLMGILTKHLYEAPIAPSQIRPDCPPELEAIIIKCIAKKQDERYQNCRELLEDMKRIEAGMPALASSSTYSQVPAIPNPSMPSITQRALPQQQQGGAGKWIGLAAILVLLGGGGTVAFMMSKQTPVVHAPVIPQVVPPPPVATQPAANTAPTPAAIVKLISEPSGAEVWSGTELLGQTPLDVPRPEGSNRLTIELRASGFTPRQVTLSALTLAPELRFTLEAERSSSRGGSRPGSSSTQQSTSGSTTEAPMMRPPSSGEVIDPWAN